MPGHKGRGPLGCEELDITEIAGADELYEAEGIIAQSEANATQLLLIIGQNALDAANARLMDVPCAMGFQIVLCDQIQTILVAQVVQ